MTNFCFDFVSFERFYVLNVRILVIMPYLNFTGISLLLCSKHQVRHRVSCSSDTLMPSFSRSIRNFLSVTISPGLMFRAGYTMPYFPSIMWFSSQNSDAKRHCPN